jgi:hypothetical protein
VKRSLFAWIGSAAAVVIVVTSVIVRGAGPADPAADVARQRTDVRRFHELVRAQRWDEVYARTTEPPATNAKVFAKLMDKQTRKHGEVTSVRIDELRLLRSRAVPFLEVRETVTVTKDGERTTQRVVSYFARRGERWLFAFSASASLRRGSSPAN